jgi:hypothetical protein
LDTRIKKGVKEFKIRWSGFNYDWDTWEPEKNLSKTLLQAYKNKIDGNKTYRITGASNETQINSLSLSEPIFRLNGQFNQVLDSQLSYYESNNWFISGSGFEKLVRINYESY